MWHKTCACAGWVRTGVLFISVFYLAFNFIEPTHFYSLNKQWIGCLKFERLEFDPMYYFQDCPFSSVFFIHCTCIMFCYLASWYLLILSCFYTVAEFRISSINLYLVFYGVSTYKGPCHESNATKPLLHSIFKTDGLKKYIYMCRISSDQHFCVQVYHYVLFFTSVSLQSQYN